MPGIVTHYKIFQDSVALLARKKKKNYASKSIESILSPPEYSSAALFGALGPNIFDYIPKRNKKNYYGNEISFFLHNGGSDKLVHEFLRRILDYKDKNNEWVAMQRAYVYGFISHIIADLMIHPFVLYFSGFPETFEKKRVYYYREQNLLFQYNIDNYYLYHHDNADDLKFSVMSMLPVKKKKGLYVLNPAIKELILNSLKGIYPEIYNKIKLYHSEKTEGLYAKSLTWLDIIPYGIKATYWFKMTRNRRLIRYANNLKRKLFFSDFLVLYPWYKRLNSDALNLHRERWQYPAGKSGLHYESIDQLVVAASEKIVEVWESIEDAIFSKKNDFHIDELSQNIYTGEEIHGYYDMEISNPIKIY